MNKNKETVRVLYSFPHKLGADRICYAAWKHVEGIAAAGAEVLAMPGVLHRPVSPQVRVRPTLARGKVRIPYKLLGQIRAGKLHDWIVSRRLPKLAGQIDIVHMFPMGGLRTIQVAKKLGITTVMERCNAHTAYAYSVVQKECERLGVTMPEGHEHAYHADFLQREEAEYEAADYLFCPSEFVARTFLERGFPASKLARFQYGYDETCYPPREPRKPEAGLKVMFAAGCAPRKGLHYALDAWLQSSAHRDGTFLVLGEFIPGYAEKLATQLSHPSVKRLGYRKDMHDLMRGCDILVLPSIEEGSALVTYDGRGCGLVLLVSDASGAVCQHGENALVHSVGDVKTLAQHFSMLHENRGMLEKLRAASLATAGGLTWEAAGRKMVAEYRRILNR